MIEQRLIPEAPIAMIVDGDGAAAEMVVNKAEKQKKPRKNVNKIEPKAAKI